MVNVAFFNPDEGLELEGWELQTVNNAHSNERAQALKKDGDELKARIFGSRHALSCEYVIAGSFRPMRTPKKYVSSLCPKMAASVLISLRR